MRRIISLIMFFVPLIVLASCGSESGGFLSRLLSGGRRAVPVVVENVSVSDFAQTFKAQALVEAPKGFDVTMAEDAVIERMIVSKGVSVNVGDPLFILSEVSAQKKLAKIRSDLRDAQDELQKNQYMVKNRDRLLEEGKIERAKFDSIEAETEAVQAKVEKLNADLAKAEEGGGSNTVASQQSGVVTSIGASDGSDVFAGMPIVSIARMDPISITFKVPSSQATSVRVGMPVSARFPDLNSEAIAGSISYVGNEIDPSDNTFQVKASIPNSANRLKVGMAAEVEISSPQRQRYFVIPSRALIKDRNRYFVFTVIKGVAHKVQVVPNEPVGERAEIVRGLMEDDLVVMRGQEKLVEGATVDIGAR